MSLKQQNKDNKLTLRYYGPYKVLYKILSMAHKLELPPSSHVQLVLHVSCLISDKITIQSILLEINDEGKIILELEIILV